MTDDQKHDAEAAVSDYLALRDEALATPEADDDERAQSAKEIVALVLGLNRNDEPPKTFMTEEMYARFPHENGVKLTAMVQNTNGPGRGGKAITDMVVGSPHWNLYFRTKDIVWVQIKP